MQSHHTICLLAKASCDIFKTFEGGVVVAGAEAGEEDVFVDLPFFLRFSLDEEIQWVREGGEPGCL